MPKKIWSYSKNFLVVNGVNYRLGIKTAQLANCKREVVLQSYSIKTPLGGKILVPKGFTTDLASTPRIAWTFFPPSGRYKTAAIVHDWLYYSGLVSQKQSDDIFLYIMRSFKVNPLTRFCMWLGVRLGGWLAFRKHRKQDDCPHKKFLIKLAFRDKRSF